MAGPYGTNHGDWFWHELTTPDPAAAAKFYGAVLDWETRSQPMGEFTYHLFRRGGEDTGGIMAMEGPMWAGIPPHWMLYVAVDDADAAKTAVEANGGKVKHGPFDIPTVGRVLVCEDPQGAWFSLCQPASPAAA